MAKIGVIINKSGGQASEPNIVEIEQTLHRRGMDYEIAAVEGKQIGAAARRMAQAGYEVIAAAGGDGTVNAVASELVNSQASLGVLPLGTLNHFAKDLGIPADIKEATEVICAGKTRQVDFATVNGRMFLNNSGIGLYPHLVRRRKIDEPSMGKWPAAMLAAWRLWKRPFTCLELQIQCNKVKRNVKTPFIFVGNNDYRIDALGLNNRQKLDEGCLVVYAHKGGSRLRLAINGLLATAGNNRRLDWVVLRGQTVAISGQSATLDVSRDGEIAGFTLPLEYQIHSGGLRVVGPE